MGLRNVVVMCGLGLGVAFVGCTEDYDDFNVTNLPPTAGAAGVGGGGGSGATGTGGVGTGGTNVSGSGGGPAGAGGGPAGAGGGPAGAGGGPAGAGGGPAGAGGGPAGAAGGPAGAAGGPAGAAGGPAGAGGGPAGAGGGPAGAGGTPCDPTEKLCGNTCVKLDDPAFGCDSPNCVPCNLPNAIAVCASGQCAIGSCRPGFEDCDGSDATGCEQDVNGDPDNCGACGRVCSSDHTILRVCSSGDCAPFCVRGWADCSQPVVDDGCELSVSSDPNNCGSCAVACQGDLQCANSICQCTAPEHCGTGGGSFTCTPEGFCVCAGVSCRFGEVCNSSGTGGLECSCNGGSGCGPQQVCCPLIGCTALLTDPDNCGACGRVCPPGASCTSGQCT